MKQYKFVPTLRINKEWNFILLITLHLALVTILVGQVNTDWIVRYNGPGNGNDVASSLAVDDQGNVYVTGYSVGSGTKEDWATIKYNSTGVQQWVQRYNGPNNIDDEACSIAVDGEGNVYVTGESQASDLDEDYVTIKYNSAGNQQWVQRYNGPANSISIDGAHSLAIDDSGNVYVTGSSTVSGFEDDYATIKYNSAGVQQWVQRYNGPGNSFDCARSIAVDGQGNVYVTGYSEGSGTKEDWATIKYNSAGIQQWVQRYNGPGNSDDEAHSHSLAVDRQGNVYVTGYSKGIDTDKDYTTIKYNADGDQQWVQRYNGPQNVDDEAVSLAVDREGNVYVTGRSSGAGSSYDWTTIKYNSAGVQQWVQGYNGPANSLDDAFSLAIDGQSNIYVLGISVNYNNDCDYLTIKYDSDGDKLWDIRYDGPGNGNDWASSIVVDGQGNVYVTGYGVGSEGNWDYTTIKYTQTP